ncbi:MAG: glycosyltransferase [Desulfovibrio sp.]|jgi:glycosyltransferase involved in cell wall biosynthesis|nr:glycosyltransferase [Desulfovibrio sp.]
MKILHLSTEEKSGGAAIAANRLHTALCNSGVDSHMGVLSRQTSSPYVHRIGGALSRRVMHPLGQRINDRCLGLHSRPQFPSYTSFNLLPSFQHRRLNALTKDILHLHWVGDGFISPWSLARLRAPVVWTMHDTWAFTGGCHYTNTGCERYVARCGQCPELRSHHEWDISRLHWLAKRRAVQRIQPIIISPSTAYARKAAKSGMLQDCRIEVIPNTLDTHIFRPIPQKQARDILGLPQDALLLLFGAMNAASDHNKGFDLLLEAMRQLPVSAQQQVAAVVFGADTATTSLSCHTHFLGRLHDAVTLALAYSAVDMFVCPSRQDNLPNTVLESLACGTPVVAFPVGGIPDMVEHGVSGWLAQAYDTAELARGISLLLNDAELRQRMGEAGRKKVEQTYAAPVIAKRHIALYEEILAGAIPIFGPG